MLSDVIKSTKGFFRHAKDHSLMIFKIKAAHAIALSATVTFLTIGGIVYNVDDASKPPLDPTKMTTSVADVSTNDTDVSKSDDPFDRPTVPAQTTNALQSGYWTGDNYESGRVTDGNMPETIISTEQDAPITSPTTGEINTPTTSLPEPSTPTVTTATKPQTTTTKPQTTTTKPQTTTTKPQTTTTKPQTTTTKPVTTTAKPVTTTTKPVTTTPPVTTEEPVVCPFPNYPDITIQSQGGLIDIEDPQEAYVKKLASTKITVTGEDRDLLERLVYGEAGNQGPVGIALVAQCIRDAMLYEGFDSVAEVRTKFQYAGSIYRGTSDLVKEVVAYIFDEGGYAVEHPILYFYAPRNGEPTQDGFHETQVFVVQYNKSRFFWKLGGRI